MAKLLKVEQLEQLREKIHEEYSFGDNIIFYIESNTNNLKAICGRMTDKDIPSYMVMYYFKFDRDVYEKNILRRLFEYRLKEYHDFAEMVLSLKSTEALKNRMIEFMRDVDEKEVLTEFDRFIDEYINFLSGDD